jgi:hypothetical protein
MIDPALLPHLTEFRLFPRLPIAVRLRIWSYSSPQGHEGRIIEVRQKIVGVESRDFRNAGMNIGAVGKTSWWS